MTQTLASAAHAAPPLDEDGAWNLLQALALSASRGVPALAGGVSVDERGELRSANYGAHAIMLHPDRESGWEALASVDEHARELLDMYLPLCAGPGRESFVMAHLGQSLDGRVATITGASRFVTGPDDLRHTHRLRALFDAVVIGVQTANVDDPQLTTRLVPGRQPVRVVLDPRARLRAQLRVLCDGRAPTIVVTARGSWPEPRTLAPHVEVIEVASGADLLDLNDVQAVLRARGLSRIFIEGGGLTVSRFLQAGLLQRLHLAVAPKIFGSGTPALQLAPIEHMSQVLTARCRRFALGADMLFDCDLS
jgi:diaminohydroxyphosphoribosylaminopyrimidine deaminase/5-amino-6-(5-phosphoribosylamino)uracil reductase